MLVGEARRTCPRKAAAALPGAPHELRFAVCAREIVAHPPDGVLTVTAEEIFG